MISLSVIVMVIFAMFKIAGFIAWSWFWVVSPVIVAIILECLVASYCWHELTGRWIF